MMPPTELAALIRRTPGPGPVEETADMVIIVGVLDDDAVRLVWLALRRSPPDYVVGIAITAVDTDFEPDDAVPPPAGMPLRITIAKAIVPGELRLLLEPFTEGWGVTLSEVDHVCVAEMPGNATFTTGRNRFQSWTLDPPTTFAALEPLRDPRAFAQDFTQDGIVVSDLRPWLEVSAPHTPCATYGAWRDLAAPRLLAALSDRVAWVGDGVSYYFGGPPSRQFVPDEATMGDLYPRACAGASWVFVDGRRDSDTRHLLLANEWARTFRKDNPRDAGEGALDSAKGAYSAYVKVGSKETLKAIADLRKSVVDETQKVSQRAQDLAGAMWKDLAVASAPFVIKILADSAKLPNKEIAGWMALAAAVFLIFSFLMMTSINRRYFERQDESRKVWSATLSAVLTVAEVEEYSVTPIRRSIEDYKAARFRVGVFYLLLVFVLVAFGLESLRMRVVPVSPHHAQLGVSASVGGNSGSQIRRDAKRISVQE